jgi:hypothetical protein
MTPFTSYGSVAPHRQAELRRGVDQKLKFADIIDNPDILALGAAIRKKEIYG